MFLELLRKNALRYANQTAIRYADESVTHAELLDRVEQRARALKDLGVQAGDRVALVQTASPDFVVSFFAVAACRAVNVPLDAGSRHEALCFYLADAEAQWAIVDEPVAGRVAGVLERLAREIHVMVVHPLASSGSSPMGTAAADDRNRDLERARADEVIAFMYSSGSTGIPKCVPRTVKQCWYEMAGVIAGLKLTCGDAIFCAIPLFHNFGAVHCMLAAAGSGAKLVMLDDPVPFGPRCRRALDLIVDEQVTVLPAVPSMLAPLAAEAASRDLSSVRLCYSATAPLPAATASALHRRFKLRVRQHYGCTEVGGLTLDLDVQPRGDGDSMGRPLPGASIRIADERGRGLGAGEVGEILARSNAMTRGYRGLDALNREVFRDGDFRTGDLGCLDEQGRLHWHGRKEFLIDAAGRAVSPHEVEAVLSAHRAVHDCVVVGAADPRGGGELVRACVVSDGTCSERELIAYCRDRLSSEKVPGIVDFVSELPKDVFGRVVRGTPAADTPAVERQVG